MAVVSGVIGLMAIATARMFAAPHEHGLDALPNVDRRLEPLRAAALFQPAAAPKARVDAENVLRSRLPGLETERHEITRSPQWVSARDGFLTGPNGVGRGAEPGFVAAGAGFAAADPHRVAKSFVNEHAALFGHDAAVLERAEVKRDYMTAHNGTRTVVWQQRHEGVEVFEAVFVAHTTKDGELMNVASQFLPDETRAAAPADVLALAGAGPAISAERSLRNAVVDLDPEAGEDQVVTALDEPSGVERRQRFSGTALRGEAMVRLVWLPMDADRMRLCWRVMLKAKSNPARYRVLVDAASGEVWKRDCLTTDLSNASYMVFTGESPTPLTPSYAAPGETAQPPTVARTLVTLSALNTTASPNGWIDDGVNETRGNNVDGHSDADGDDVPDLPRPQGSPNRVFNFPLNLANSPATHRAASVVNVFYWCNWMHDKLYELGFTEDVGNFQNNNFGRGGVGGDAVRAQAQDGEGFRNANFSYTDADGEVCDLQMYLFNDPSPYRDGSLDAQIIIHEYVHGLSQRLVGGGVGLNNPQSKGMGEGWSDFYAVALLSQSSDDLHGNYVVGAYVLKDFDFYGKVFASPGDNYYFGIRRYPYSIDMNVSPLTFKDIDPTKQDLHPGIPIQPQFGGGSASEVHNQGEVWCMALLECRANLIAKLGFNPGNQLILQLVTDGMKYSPPNPNFLQARDGILQAELALTGGAHRKELWAGFAKRGMGYYATSPASSTTSGVVENFDVLDNLRVFPAGGISVSGPVGGPFTSSNLVYTISNSGPGSVTWRAHVETPLELSVNSGTLAAGARQTALLMVNATAAATLPVGTYTRSVVISNQTSGAVFKRSSKFVVGAGVPFAEMFGLGSDTNDLAGTLLTFTPVDNGTRYDRCIQDVAAFPSSTVAATTLTLGDDEFQEVSLTGGKQVTLFGVNYGSLFVGANGYITFGEGDTEFTPSAANHFRLPRVSAFFGDLNPAVGGRVSWQQFTNRAVVTWENVSGVSVQAELSFDGRIRVATLQSRSGSCLVGLSSGEGMPPDYSDVNLSVSPSCSGGTIFLTLPAQVSEGMGSITGRVQIATPRPNSLTVFLSSSDTSELSLPETTVIIPPFGRGAEFVANVVNDASLDGSQIVYLTASAPGLNPDIATVWVHDNESASLTLGSPSASQEGGFLGYGIVRVSAPVQDTVGVTLTSSRPDELLPVPSVVFIPQGQTSAVYTVQAVDDIRIDGLQSATLTASVTNWPSAVSFGGLTIDNEDTRLRLTSAFFLNESLGTVTNGCTVSLSGTLPTNFLVAVISDDESEIRTPLFGGVIPAGQTNVTLPLFVQDDSVVDGAVIVRLRAIGGNFTPATNFVFVADNDGPAEPYDPYPPHESVDIPVTADLRWGRVEGEMIVNGGFESGDLAGWTLDGGGAGGYTINDGTYDPASSDGPLPPFAGNFAAIADQFGNGTHALYQDVVIPAGATDVTLAWSDRIRNHAVMFAGNQQFRVELRKPEDNTVLATLFATTNGMPLLNDWSNRVVNLKAWRGQTVRLAFVEVDGLGYLNVHLDNVSLLAPGVALTTFDVYFGTNNPPTSGDLIGATTNTSFPLPLLGGGLDYYWQLRSRRGAATNAGPVWQFTTEGASTNTALVAFGSSWRYRNTGQNLGTAWTNLNFNDSAWSSGLGSLGFGGAEDTTIGGQTSGFTTFYFRRKFNVADPSRVVALRAQLTRDDGAVVWLNGRVAMFSNVPRPPITYDVEALSAVTILGRPVVDELPASLLVAGTNVLAVEIHQYNPGTPADDLLFDFELKALINNGNELPATTITAPDDFTHVTAPTNVLIQASVQDESFFLLGFTVEFYANGVKLGQDTVTPFSFTWTNPPPGLHQLTSVAIDSGGLRGTSAPVRLVVSPASGTLITLTPVGSRWSYLDNGVYPGASWTTPGFRPTRGWKSGFAQLGYGEGDEATEVGYGDDPLDKHITTWFRQNFVNNAALSTLTLRLLRDDGAAVYLNGTEILRNNLPAGPLTATTLASINVAGAAESVWVTANLPASVPLTVLRPGNNTLAVEVHQASVNSPDLSFDLELFGAGNLLPTVSVTSPANHAVVPAPSSLLITASAIDPYGAVTNVQFRRNGVLLGVDATPPYQYQWNNPPAGAHVLTAVATDDSGGSTVSSEVNLFIAAPVSLAITRNGGIVQLAWPETAPGYTLETASSLVVPIEWTPSTNAVTQSAGQFRVELPPGETERYFRLRAP